MTCLRPSINQEVNDVSKTKVTPQNVRCLKNSKKEKI